MGDCIALRDPSIHLPGAARALGQGQSTEGTGSLGDSGGTGDSGGPGFGADAKGT